MAGQKTAGKKLPGGKRLFRARTRAGTVAAAAPARKKRRFKSGTRALWEIRKLQLSTDFIIPKAPFVRVIKDIIYDMGPFRIQASAVKALQEAAEMTIVTEFEMTNLAAIHAKRVTIQVKDMKLVQAMREIMTGCALPGGLHANKKKA